MLDALARVLQLDADAARHLRALGTSSAASPRTGSRPERVRPEFARLLDHHVDAPAFVLGRRLDVLAANRLARILHPSFTPGRNVVRDVFLDPAAQLGYADVEPAQRNAVASLRAAAGALPDDQRLTELVGELSLKSAVFRQLWSRHEIRTEIAGRKRFDHPEIGELVLDYDSMTISGSAGQQLVVYHADPGGSQTGALALLRALAADEASTTAARSRRPEPRGPASGRRALTRSRQQLERGG